MNELFQLPEGFTYEEPGTAEKPFELPEGFTFEKPELEGKQYARGLLQNALRGISLGFGDEIVAALTAVPAALSTDTSAIDAYKDIVGVERENQQRFAQENPKTAFAAEFGGAALTGGAGVTKALGKATATKLGGKLLTGATSNTGRAAQFTARQAAIGAPIGAIYGAGAAEGDITDRLEGAGKGAVIGAVAAPIVGGAAIGAANLAGTGFKGINYLINRARDTDEKAAYRGLATMFGDMQLSTETAKRNLARAGSEATLIDAGGFPATRSGVPVGPIEKGSALVDMAEHLANKPGKPRQLAMKAATARLRGMYDRVGKLVQNKIVGKDKTFDQAFEESIIRRQKQAGPLYAKARKTLINNDASPIDDGPSLRELLGNGEIQKLVPKAITKVQDDIRLPAAQRTNLAPDNPSFAVWDQVKKDLSAKVTKAKIAGNTGEVSRYTALKNALVDQIDPQVKSYKMARKIYQDEHELTDALTWGQNIFQKIADKKIAVDQIQNEFAQFSKAGQEHARIGAGQVVQNILDNTRMTLGEMPSASLISQFYSSPAQRKVINMLIPDKAGQRAFERMMNAERATQRNFNQIFQGSQTKRRFGQSVVTKFDQVQDAGLNVFYASTGNRWAAFKVANLIGNMFNSQARKQAISQLQAEILFSKDQNVISKAFSEIGKIIGENNMAPKALEISRMNNREMFNWAQDKTNLNYIQHVLGSKTGLKAAIASQQAGQGDESMTAGIMQTLDDYTEPE